MLDSSRAGAGECMTGRSLAEPSRKPEKLHAAWACLILLEGALIREAEFASLSLVVCWVVLVFMIGMLGRVA